MGTRRVMMLSTDLEKGGLPLRLATLARRLRAADLEPIVGCLARRGPLSAELEAAGIETFSCDAAGGFDASCLARLARQVRRLRPDLIHSALFHANLAARMVGQLDRDRPIVTSTVTIEIERRWHRLLESLTIERSDLHVANSRAVAKHLREDLGFPPRRVTVIPNGLDIAAIDAAAPARRGELGVDEQVPLIVWAGRLDPVKNLETFVRVIERVRAQRDVRALVLGDGPARPAIERLAADLRLQRVVQFFGWSENVVGCLKSADVLLFPSWTEGSPNVVLEAMASRCPVVASAVPGCAELIDTGRTGLLCPAADVACFARAVIGLLEDRSAAQRLAAAARDQVVRRHEIGAVVRVWREAYERLV
ncbi:MAG: glycosyltransferase [Phycisphaerae bacterium]